MGTLTDGIGASSKRTSRFGGQSSQTSEPGQIAEGAAQAASKKVAETENELETDNMVEPSMKSTEHRPSVATTSTIPKALAKAYLERTLDEISTFKRQLKFKPEHQENNVYPPHAYMFGKSVPTVYGARVSSVEAIKYEDAFDDLVFAAGDGVVLASAAQLPDGYRCVRGGRVETDRGHVGLLGDLEGVGRCLEALIDARAKGVGLGINVTTTSSQVTS
jgi:hypothetical protein